MDVALLDPDRDGDAFYRLYLAYVEELSGWLLSYGNPYIQPQPWWVNDPDSLVQVVRADEQLAGFVINGWRSRVDADTDSEILELYVAPAFRRQRLGYRLAQLALAHLTGVAGFQVYLDNAPAQQFWPQVLRNIGIRYTTFAALEQNIPVVKYRFVVG